MAKLVHGFAFAIFFLSLVASLPVISSTARLINSNSVLLALLESHYTELAELVEKAVLLQKLEEAVGSHNITIFAPTNEALERQLNPEFKHFLLEPGNLKSLQSLLTYHLALNKIGSTDWPGWQSDPMKQKTLSNDDVLIMSERSGKKLVGFAEIIRENDVIRPDGVIHGIDRLLVPQSVLEDFNRRRNLRSISAVLPEGAPEDRRTSKTKKLVSALPPGSSSFLPSYNAMAPGPSLAPAPAPGPGGAHHNFDGESQVNDFIQTLIHFGGYNEMADILVNLTSLASELARLVSEGYMLTVLAPNDEAMAKLTVDQLSESGAPEKIFSYHIIPEYQTEESMYNAARRFGKVSYDTLAFPYKVVAQEAEGSVLFGTGEGSAYLFDPDIHTDGRISVQGLDNVLFHDSQKIVKKSKMVKLPSKPRRGKLMEVACGILAALGHDSHFAACN